MDKKTCIKNKKLTGSSADGHGFFWSLNYSVPHLNELQHVDGVAGLAPFDVQIENPRAEGAVRIVGLVGGAGVVGEHVGDELPQCGALRVFEGLDGAFRRIGKADSIGGFRGAVRKGAGGGGDAVGVGDVGLDVEHGGSVEEVAAAEAQFGFVDAEELDHR